MSLINPLAREVSAKIVYYGPGLSGKTTSLKYIHSVVKPDRRGELVSLATEGDRTLFFDFLPVRLERVQDMPLRLQLYTVPGQVFYASTRKLVLNGADGVVFVADSQEAARETNEQSLEDLIENLIEMGVELDRFPIVLQFNKRDLPGALPRSVLEGDLNRFKSPAVETCATTGMGILPALKEVTRLVVRELNARAPKARLPAQLEPSVVGEEGIASSLSAHVAALEPELPEPASAPAPVGFSFAGLWTGDPPASLAVIESALRAGRHGDAVRAAAGGLAQLLHELPGATASDGPMSKTTLLGLDGREYLKLCRLASAPDAALEERDALFALYLLVAARVKATAI